MAASTSPARPTSQRPPLEVISLPVNASCWSALLELASWKTLKAVQAK